MFDGESKGLGTVDCRFLDVLNLHSESETRDSDQRGMSTVLSSVLRSCVADTKYRVDTVTVRFKIYIVHCTPFGLPP